MEQRSNYQFELKIFSNQGAFEAKGIFDYIHLGSKTDTLVFYLHKDTSIDFIHSDSLGSYFFDQEGSPLLFLKDSRPLHIKLNKEIFNHERIQFAFNYTAIPVRGDFAIGEISTDYVELGMYLPWFPLTPNLDLATFDVKIKLDSKTMDLIGAKGLSKHNDGYHLFQTYLSNDAMIIGSNQLENQSVTKAFDDFKLSVYYVDENDHTYAKNMIEMCDTILSIYKDMFGKRQFDDFKIVCVKRIEGGGYNRLGMVVLARTSNPIDFENKTSLLNLYAYLAHELAHTYFYKASVSTYEDWLNEGFAQFAQLIAVKKYFGVEYYQKIIDRYKESSKHLKNIYHLDRTDPEAYQILYHKAPVLIIDWMNRIGENKFVSFVKDYFQNQEINTNNFINQIKQHFGSDIAQMVLKDLGMK